MGCLCEKILDPHTHIYIHTVNTVYAPTFIIEIIISSFF